MRRPLRLARIALLTTLTACAAADEEPPAKRGTIEDALPGGPMHNPAVNPGGAVGPAVTPFGPAVTPFGVAVTPFGVSTPQPGNPNGAPAMGDHLPVQPAQRAPER